MSAQLPDAYQERYDRILIPIADKLSSFIADHLKGMKHIDRVTARAKSPDRFLEKASRRENGQLHYTEPLVEIQDQIGARVNVFYLTDVQTISEQILRYFRTIELRVLEPASALEFGYFGEHLMLALPTDVIPVGIDPSEAPRFFELQIKTLFQHAWSEANHDFGYKPVGELHSDERRLLAYAASLAWGADGVFKQLITKSETK